MHWRRSVIDKREFVVPAPFEMLPDTNSVDDPESETLENIVEIDAHGTFVGRLSPRQIDLIVDVLTDAGLL